MKRLLLTTLCLSLPLALVGCGGKAVEPPKNTNISSPPSLKGETPGEVKVPKGPGG